MQTENVAQFPEGLDLVEFDNLEPFGTEDPKAFSSDNARGGLREFQSLDELGEAARVAGERFKACFAAR